MVFKRKVYDKLLEWKELSAGTSAVLLEGARRIGKSTIVEEFAKREYDDYMIYLDIILGKEKMHIVQKTELHDDLKRIFLMSGIFKIIPMKEEEKLNG